MKVIIINGPNLNLLGKREESIYGNISFEEYFDKLKANFPRLELEYYQSNIEGEIVEKIQKIRKIYNGVIINAAGYTHTSVAILDALSILKIPVIELHITNIYNREEFRHKSLISKVARGIICGFGVKGYIMALDAMKNILKNENR